MAVSAADPVAAAAAGEYLSADAARPLLPSWLGPNALRALAGFVGGVYLGKWCGNVIAGSQTVVGYDLQNQVAVILALSFGVLGWLTGAGMLSYPIAKMLGREPLEPVPGDELDAVFQADS